jgi:protocatechuate 3,4-dioxygenase beta subunit
VAAGAPLTFVAPSSTLAVALPRIEDHPMKAAVVGLAVLALAAAACWLCAPSGPRAGTPSHSTSDEPTRNAILPAPPPTRSLVSTDSPPPASGRSTGSASVAGIVVDAEGSPVENARVRIRDGAATTESFTGGDGRFRVALSASGVSRDASIDAEGFAPRGFVVGALEAGEERRLDVVLSRGATLRGRVVDGETGSLVRGATVTLESERALLATARADDGTFAIDHVPAATWPSTDERAIVGRLRARAPGFHEARMDAPLSNDSATIELEIRLWREATITGRVVDARGRPLACATVWATSERADERVAGTSTDGRGRFRLEVAAASSDATEARVRVRRSKRGDAIDAEVVVAVHAGESVVAPNLVVPRAGMRAAWLRFVGPDGRAVAWATASTSDEIVSAGEDGVALLVWPRAEEGDSAVVRVRADDFASRTLFVTPSAADPPTVDVVLEPGHRLRGRVVRPDGRPHPSADVRATAADVEVGWSVSRGDGTFEMPNLPAGPLTVTARANGLSSSFDRTTTAAVAAEVAADTDDLVLVLDDGRPAGAVAGTVVDAETGRVVTMFSADVAIGGRWVNSDDEGAGRFTVTGLPSGRWRVDVRASGYQDAAIDGVEVVDGGPPADVQVVLSRGTSIEGTVHAPSGPKLAGWVARFVQVGEDGDFISFGPAVVHALVRDDESFRVGGVEPGRYRLELVSPPSLGRAARVFAPASSAQVEVPDGASTVRVDAVVEEGGTIVIALDDPRLPELLISSFSSSEASAEFGAAASIEVRDARGVLVFEQRALSGRFSDEETIALPRGEYHVRIELLGETPRERTIVVEPGSSTPVHLAGEK